MMCGVESSVTSKMQEPAESRLSTFLREGRCQAYLRNRKGIVPMKAIWNGVVIAESREVVEIEGNVYFPLSSLDRRYVSSSNTHTTCPWKGEASYFSLNVNGQINRDAAWYYPNPKAGAEAVRDRVAFWRGVQVEP